MESVRLLLLLLLFINDSLGLEAIYNCDWNYVARAGGGILVSPNFPFDFPTNQDCEYTISFKSINAILDKKRKLCLTFYRFRLNPDITRCTGTNAYLSIPGQDGDHRYCSRGHSDTADDSLNNVFNPNFCWDVAGNTIVIHFHSGNINGRGFYAKFDIVDEPQSPAIPIASPDPLNTSLETTYAPCPVDHETCFNRKCVAQNLVCDTKNDCNDNSDEDFANSRCAGKQSIFGCNFDDDTNKCGFGGTNWLVGTSSTYGPRYDHTIGEVGGPGMFAFSQFGSVTPSVAIINYVHTIPRSVSPRCLSFWYFLSGYDVDAGAIHVFMDIDTTDKKKIKRVWIRQNNQGNDWLFAQIDIPVETPVIHEIRFQFHKGKYESNLALDDIALLQSPCWADDVSCTFVLGYCTWTNDQRGGLEWRRNKGSTLTYYTGPTTDSWGDSEGYYLYIPTSSGKHGSYARLLSRYISNSMNPGRNCLAFYYHMYGTDVKDLYVRIFYEKSNKETVIWKRNGDHGDRWLSATVGLLSIDSGAFQIIFEAWVGYGEKGDIAIDDIQLRRGPCTTGIATSSPSATTKSSFCNSEQFRCDDGDCISASFRCDNHFDCPDHSDEHGCTERLNPGIVAGIVSAVLLTFLVLMINVAVWTRKHNPNTRDRHWRSVHDSRHVFTFQNDTLDVNEPQDVGDPPPPYITPGTTEDAATRPPRVSISLRWEPPPSYAISIVASPRLDPNLEEDSANSLNNDAQDSASPGDILNRSRISNYLLARPPSYEFRHNDSLSSFTSPIEPPPDGAAQDDYDDDTERTGSLTDSEGATQNRPDAEPANFSSTLPATIRNIYPRHNSLGESSAVLPGSIDVGHSDLSGSVPYSLALLGEGRDPLQSSFSQEISLDGEQDTCHQYGIII